MKEVCNHTSVGMVVERDGKILLIERNNFPFTYALPAGHVDEGETYEEAAVRELKEEVGLDAEKIELIAEGRVENPCSRPGGTWHYWRFYKINAMGDVNRSERETKQATWFTREQIRNLPPPGYEPIMYEWNIAHGVL
jgi:ADP-ribose pyrophosphatase YjhB (NUDIX family)